MTRRVLWLLIVAAGAWWWLSGPALVIDDLQSEPTLQASVAGFDRALSLDRPPLQRDFDNGSEPLRTGDFRLTRRAEFELEARVLGRRDYRFDRAARLSPVDLALGWGPMSDPEVLEHIRISQRGRFYFWRVREFPIARRDIERNSANMHMIPASAEIARQLRRVREDQVIRLSGYLVDVDRDDGWRWRTSMTRDDTGDGACEIVLVTRVEWR